MLLLVAGGQYGGEGKGNIVAAMASNLLPDALIKTGGPNSAHTYGDKLGALWKLRTLPAGSSFFGGDVIYPAGCLLSPASLFAEMDSTQTSARVSVDPRTGVLLDRHVEAQREDGARYLEIGSTMTGTGAAAADRCLRRLPLAREIDELQPHLADTQSMLLDLAVPSRLGIIEGSQSYGLSNYFGDYPYVTSRDSSIPGLWAQLGISSKYLGASILVMKAFPTRNRHGDGTEPQLYGEPELESAVGPQIEEYGGGDFAGGDRRRRVGLFDWSNASRVIQVMSPDFIAVTGLDRIRDLVHVPLVRQAYGGAEEFLQMLETRLGVPVGLASYGPLIEDVIMRQPFLDYLGTTAHARL